MEKDLQIYARPRQRQPARWFSPFKRDVGMWAFALNRITGLGLVLYLFLHLVVLSLLLGGPAAWDSFISLARSPAFLMLDVILLAGMLIHGLNGVRVTLVGLGFAVEGQKGLFLFLMVVAAIVLVLGAMAVFTM
jgi:succinate dehydrogenase / fumarate reductase cytochrome b subunit